MGLQGRLKKDGFGYSMPVDAPLYPPFPVHYKDMSLLTYVYVTDAEQAAAVLPAPLRLTDPPLAQVGFAHYPFSNVGAYNEVLQSVFCTYDGQPWTYSVRLHVTTDIAMAAGREIGGFAKKLGHIEFDYGDVVSSHLDRPAGHRLASAVFMPEQPVDRELPASNIISLRVLPNPEDASKPTLAQLIGSTWQLENGRIWSGKGSANLTGASELDPYHRVPIVEPLPVELAQKLGVAPCSLFRGDMTVAKVEILQDL